MDVNRWVRVGLSLYLLTFIGQGRKQQIFLGGQNDVNLLLYLANTYIFENFGGDNCLIAPPMVAGLL